jgi:molecular chaperone GrpE
MKFLESLKEYSKHAVLVAKKNLDMEKIQFDHVCYQTTSAKDYENTLKRIKDELKVICEIPHAGRRITVAELKNPFEVEGVTINRVEVSEPKPKRTVTKRNFDHLAFVVNDGFSQFLEELKIKEIKITEIKQIGDHKIAKFVGNNIEIELRNRSVCDQPQKFSQVEKETSTSQGSDEDLRKQIELEREQKLRALADYQNLQKRVESESQVALSASNSTIMATLLDCLDDLDRIIENLKKGDSDITGLEMLRGKMQKVIDENGLEEIACKAGDEFNMHEFEAVGVVDASESEENKVKEVVQKGYKLKDNGNIVRLAKVIVGKRQIS